jgi:branched-subunit amino acid transport protein
VALTTTAWVVIGVAGVATFAIRASFLLMAGKLDELPEPALELLRLIPAAALAALIGPAIFRPDGELVILGPRPLAGLVALGVALLTRSVLLTIAVGLGAVVVFEALLG